MKTTWTYQQTGSNMSTFCNNERTEKGRGTSLNPANKYAALSYERMHSEAIDDWETSPRQTEFIVDDSKTLVNKVTSPDVGMLYSANPYQGCEHGCIYCYARNSHEYWGYSAGIDFESKIVVKKNAPALLRQFFDNRNWQPATLSLSGNTDCYQPIERSMKITRALLEICLDYRNPVGIITKNALVLRDTDLLQELAKRGLARVFVSITSTDERLRLQLEPRTATYKARFGIIEKLAAAGVPVGVMNAPLIPGINDMHQHDVLQRAANAGAQWAGYTVVRLNGAVGPLFRNWLYEQFPDRAEKVWNQICECHGGKVNDSRWGNRIIGEGKFATLIQDQFRLWCRKYGLNQTSYQANLNDFRRPKGNQLSLF